MRTITAKQAAAQFSGFVDMAQREPVRIVQHDRVMGVMVPAGDYEAMRALYTDRLTRTLDQTAAHAAAANLTPGQLKALLSDES